MAENPASSEQPARARTQELWVVAALAMAALICISALTVALVFLLGRQQNGPAPAPIQNSIVNNNGPAGAPPAGIQRPAEPAKPQADRSSAMDRTQPALPGILASPTPMSGQRKVALTRDDPPSPPSPPTPDLRKVHVRVRSEPASQYTGEKALPMPVRYGTVFAAKGASDPAQFSFQPDVAFADSGIRGVALDLQLSSPRKTSAVDGFRAPKGFQFFTGKLTVRNDGGQAVPLGVDSVEVSDVEGVRYLANPELVVGDWPAAPLAPGGEIQAELSFLVPDTAPLKDLAVQEGPGQTARLPLQAR